MNKLLVLLLLFLVSCWSEDIEYTYTCNETIQHYKEDDTLYENNRTSLYYFVERVHNERYSILNSSRSSHVNIYLVSPTLNFKSDKTIIYPSADTFSLSGKFIQFQDSLEFSAVTKRKLDGLTEKTFCTCVLKF